MDQQGHGGYRDDNPLRLMLAALDRLATRLNEAIVAARPAFDRFNARTQAAARALAPVGEWIAKNGPTIAATLIALRRFAAEAHIENWSELDDREWMSAVQLMQDDGVPLAWLPPIHVVKALVASTDHESRNTILLTNASEIADRADELLAEVNHERLVNLASSVSQAWAAWRDGHIAPAQALAAACVGDVIEDHRGFDGFAAFRKRYEPFRSKPVEGWTLAVAFRRTVLDCALVAATLRREEQIPGFNRHATVHHVSPEQYTSANCLRALMLVTALARELQFDYSDEWSSMTAVRDLHPQALQVATSPAGIPPSARPMLPSTKLPSPMSTEWPGSFSISPSTGATRAPSATPKD